MSECVNESQLLLRTRDYRVQKCDLSVVINHLTIIIIILGSCVDIRSRLSVGVWNYTG